MRSAALCTPPSPPLCSLRRPSVCSARSAVLAATLADGHLPGSALRAAFTAALGSSNRFEALCAPPSSPFQASAMSLAALCAPHSPPLFASAIARQRSMRPLCRRIQRRPFIFGALRTALAAASCVGHSLGSALHVTFAAALGDGDSLCSALRAALAVLVCQLLAALCALGSAVHAALAAAMLSASAISLQRSERRPRSHSRRRAFTRQRSARRLHRRSRQQ